MIRLAEGIAPEQSVLDKLAGYQSEVISAGNYAAQVGKAKECFSAYNKRGNATFDAVKVALTQMCSGARRCCYCEDAPADEVEHIWPKDLYPDKVFVWENYLYACGPCNGPKSNGFAVFQGGMVQSVARPRNAPMLPPLQGDAVLINPRHEDPLDYLILDLGTWYFGSRHPIGTKEEQRATYTITLLHLNDREYLLQAREEAYEGYLALLEKYVRLKKQNQDTRRTIEAIHRRGHPTVWREIQRQSVSYSDLHELFREAPEALLW